MNFGIALAAGVVAGAAYCVLSERRWPQHARAIYAVTLGYVAAVYVGPALSRGAPGDVLELLASLAFTACAVAGLVGAEVWLAAGYILHGMWDAFHVDPGHAALPRWYPPLCIGFDWVLGVWILRGLKKRRAAARAAAVDELESSQ